MSKNSKKPKRKSKKRARKSTKRLGRPQELDIQDLSKRLRDMKYFLENCWGRVGLGLRAARDPEDVRATLNLVPNIDSYRPFREHASCLIEPSATSVSGNELRETRRKLKLARTQAESLWSEYNRVHQESERARAAVKGTFDGYRTVLPVSPLFLFVVQVLAQELKLEEQIKHAQTLDSISRQARADADSWKKKLRAQEAWFARNEVVKFARNRRYDKTLLNFARAMAGLPEWGWFHSRRSCETIRDETTPATPYLLFQTIEAVTRRMKLLTMTKLEKRLRDELLRADIELFLGSYAATHWHYLQEAIQFCRGKDFRRRDLPFKIMDRFLFNLEQPKTIADLELARRNQLSSS